MAWFLQDTCSSHFALVPAIIHCTLTQVFEQPLVFFLQENKSMVDTDKGSWNQLFKEFEEEGVSKWHVHSHDFERAEDRDGLKPRFLDVQVVIQEIEC